MVKIEILNGKTSNYKKAVINGVHNAIADAVEVSKKDIIQRLYEISEEFFIQPSNRSVDLTIIEISLYPGRSEFIKKNLYETIVKYLGQSPGIKAKDIIIVLYEPPMENWAFQCENLIDK